MCSLVSEDRQKHTYVLTGKQFRQMDRHTHKHAGVQSHKRINAQTGTQTFTHMHTQLQWTDASTYIHRDLYADPHTHKPVHIQKHRHTDIELNIYRQTYREN